MPVKRLVAVIGAGISGLGAARALSRHSTVTLYEAAPRCGGHAHTVDITLDGIRHGVDTGFLVLNERTYPELLRLFAELDIELAKSEMSFSVQVPDAGLEWSGSNVDSVFAQRGNLLRPAFLRMLADLRRFNRHATALAEGASTPGAPATETMTIGEFLDRERYSQAFRDWYFLPMIGSIWSCPTDQMLRFPVATMLRFCHNHGLLQVTDRPQWYTVRGGSRRYVERIVEGLDDVRTATPVHHVRRGANIRAGGGVEVCTDAGTERYDDVVFACHSNQALALLDDPRPEEQKILGAIRYQRNRAVLHTDASVLPTRGRAWAAWNYERAAEGARERASVCLHYLINRLQPLPFTTPVVVSLNPLAEPRADQVHGDYDYEHPVFDAAAIDAQQRLPALQGVDRTWYCGAWTRYGFHEDGLMSGLAVAAGIAARDRDMNREAAARELSPALLPA